MSEGMYVPIVTNAALAHQNNGVINSIYFCIENNITFGLRWSMVSVSTMTDPDKEIPAEATFTVWDDESWVIVEPGDWIAIIKGQTLVWPNAKFRAFFTEYVETA